MTFTALIEVMGVILNALREDGFLESEIQELVTAIWERKVSVEQVRVLTNKFQKQRAKAANARITGEKKS